MRLFTLNTIRVQLIVAGLSSWLVFLLVFLGVRYVFTPSILERKLAIEAAAREIDASVPSGADVASPLASARHIRDILARTGTRAIIVARNGHPFDDAGTVPPDVDAARAKSMFQQLIEVQLWNDKILIPVPTSSQLQPYVVALKPRSETYSLWIIFVVSVGAALLFLMMLSSRKLRYLSGIAARLNGYRGTELEPLPVRGSDEIATLVKGINAMTETMEQERRRELQASRERFALLTGLSHDLRSPLTSIRGYLDLITSGHASPEDVQSYATVASMKAQELTRLVNDLFKHSRLIEPLPIEADFQIRFDLIVLLRQAVSEFATLLEERRIEIALDLPRSAMVKGDPLRIKRLIENLLDNARKYASAGGALAIAAEAAPTWLRVKFSNEVTAGASENGEIGSAPTPITIGAGFGLGIARQIAEDLGGHIHVEGANGRFSVTVGFPISPTEGPA